MSMRIAFTLTGRTPLLFHADDLERNDVVKKWQLDTKNKDQSVRGDDRFPPWTWWSYLYDDGKNIAWPSANVMVGLRQAGAQIQIPGGKNGKTFKEKTQSGINVYEEFFDFYVGTGKDAKRLSVATITPILELPFAEQCDEAKKHGFTLFCKRARVGQSKHVRARARFNAWMIRGEVTVTAPEITLDLFGKMIEIAGSIGQGDWRPGCKTPGPFGQFKAEWKKVG